VALALLAVAACAPKPLLARAIAARGGPLPGFVRESEARVARGFPGTWRWRQVYLVPDRYAWTIYTAGEPDHYLFDGTTARAFVGGAPVSATPGATSPLRTHARFVAVVNLDALALPGVALAPLAPGDLSPGAARGLDIVFADDGARYRLAFDARDLLVAATGPLALPPFGSGTVTARFADFVPRGRFRLPARTTWTLGDTLLAEERVLAACPDPAGLDPGAFAAPTALPDCPPGGAAR
jgi:hypothetical protein